MPFNGNQILTRVCLLSCLPFSWGKGWLLSWGGAFLLCSKKRLEDFYSPKLFFYITAHFCWDSLSLHNASSSFRTGSFSAVLFALFASAVFTVISFLSSRSVSVHWTSFYSLFNS